MQEILSKKIEFNDVKKSIIESFGSIFQTDAKEKCLDEII
jgi:hypothetical protein